MDFVEKTKRNGFINVFNGIAIIVVQTRTEKGYLSHTIVKTSRTVEAIQQMRFEVDARISLIIIDFDACFELFAISLTYLSHLIFS